MITSQSILLSVLFDSDSKIKESELNAIREDIESDRMSLNPILVNYKKKTPIIEGSIFFALESGEKILISEDVVDSLIGMSIDKEKLVSFMSRSKNNTKQVINKVLGL